VDQPEIEDDGPLPKLDPSVEAKVRALLAAAPPRTMPSQVSQRLESALSDEVALRVDRGPQNAGEHEKAVRAPNKRHRQPPRTQFANSAVAAAAAVVAVGGSALHLNKPANGAASLSNPSAVVSSRITARPNLHVQSSGTDYTAAQLPAQARDLLARPGEPVTALGADTASLGPMATEIGLESCLLAQRIPLDLPVHVDLASFEGLAAAIIVVDTGGTRTVRVVARTCQQGSPDTIRDAVPVP